MEIQGTIITCSDIASGLSKTSGNEWKRVSAVLQTDGQFPKHLAFDLFNDKVDRFAIKVGDEIKLSFDIDAKEYNGKWYNDIRVRNIEKMDILPAPTHAEYKAAQQQEQQQRKPAMPIEMLVKPRKEPIGQVVTGAQQQLFNEPQPNDEIDALPF